LILSKPLAPKLKHNSTSLLPPSIIIVVKLATLNDVLLIELPNSIPHMGIMYCGFHRGYGRRMIPKAKRQTKDMEMDSVQKVKRG
jgi:hypothetical protein